jgi:hypothetical protein
MSNALWVQKRPAFIVKTGREAVGHSV